MSLAPRHDVADAAPRSLSDWLLRWESILVVLLFIVICRQYGDLALFP